MRLPFTRAAAPQLISLPRGTRADDAELASMAEMNDVNMAIEVAMRRAMSADYYAYESADNQGGGFATEFDIRATAGRIKGLYSREPWIYTSATHVARTLSTVPMRVWSKKQEKWVDSHPLIELLAAGSVAQSALESRWAGTLDTMLGGNKFLILDESFKKVIGLAPVELVNLRMSADFTRVDGIEVTPVGGQSTATNRFFKMEHVVHTKMPNPYTPFYGMSPFTAAARPILLDRYKTEFEMAFYLRGASSTGVIETTEDMSKSRLQRMMRSFESAFTGRANWWRTLFLPKGAKWTKAGLTMAEMQHLEGLKENRKTILAVMGIPGSIVGLIEDVNRATAEQQERIFWANTIIPTALFEAAGWNNSYLVKTIYKDVEVRPDFTGIAAVEGSVQDKGDRSKAMEPFFTINEIREKVWGEEPLAPEVGDRFVAEVRAPGGGPLLLAAPVAAEKEPTALPPAIEAEVVDDSGTKGLAADSQNRLERRLGSQYEMALTHYIDSLLEQAREAIGAKRDVRAYLAMTRDARIEGYRERALPVLDAALERGFSAAAASLKMGSGATKAGRFLTGPDRQALDLLKERTRDGQRKLLAQRALKRFEGLDDTQTELVMRLIERGMEAGRSFEEIARAIRTDYGEAYGNQSRTIVRTEILSAASQGLAWNHETLGKIFTEVKKQWIHQGDVGVNPDAREEHLGFDEMGEVPSDYVWHAEDGSQLAFPRDPNATPGNIINCRCTMISVIPDSAISHSDAILENDG